MIRQLTFDLAAGPSFARSEFFVSATNRLALASVDDWQSWPQGKLILTGPSGAGKSHLARIWAAGLGAPVIEADDLAAAMPPAPDLRAVVIEAADRIAGNEALETALFHLVNILTERDGHLLLTARRALPDWGIVLPDLASRLQTAGQAVIEPPDDALLQAVLVKLFADRQIKIEPNLIAYLLPRMHRTIAAARDLVEALDLRALAENRPVSRALAAEMTARGGLRSDFLDSPGSE